MWITPTDSWNSHVTKHDSIPNILDNFAMRFVQVERKK